MLKNFAAFCFNALVVVVVLNVQVAWSQGFLEMPDTTQVPDYERETMLMDLDIPAVRDRDPDPEAGPRLNVKEFRLQGVVEYPDLGITREEIVKRIEAIRFDIMEEGDYTDSGFTLDELGEFSKLFMEMERSTQDRHVGPVEVQQFVFLIREQLRNRGVTLGMIETVADTITQFYRENGFILAKAYIPKQEVRDGVVTLTLLLGELGEIDVEGDKRVSRNMIARTFKRDMYKPVTNENIDEALTLINDIPGLRAQGFLSPGTQVGDTRMTVKVNEEKWTTVNLRLDNHGSESTSKNRAYVDVYVHNPLGIGDEVYLGVLKTYNPDQSTYGAFRYNSFILNPRWRASVGYSNNDFVSRNLRGVGATFFTGESQVADASMRYIFQRSRVSNYSTELKYMDIDTQLDTQASVTEEDVNKTSLGFNFDLLNEKWRHLYLGNITYHQAKIHELGGFEGETTGSESFVTFDVSMLNFFKLPFSNYETRWLWKANGQYAGEGLSNLNQINLTGPSRARSFGVNGFQSDDGLYFGADWIFSFPKFGGQTLFGESISRVFQPFVFFDTAYGVIHPLQEGSGEGEITGTLADAGIGIKMNHSRFSGGVTYGRVLEDQISELQDETPSSKLSFELQLAF